jgi:hypothetical protein
LSSWTVVLNDSVCSVDCCIPFMEIRRSSRIGIVDRSAILSAEYSLSCVDGAMQYCRFDGHTSGDPTTSMTKTVRHYTLSGSFWSWYSHPPA